jgi:cytochrome P450
MLSVLMDSRDPETGEPMPDDALMNELRTLFIAGFETTANAFSWTLYLLARNPGVAERWHREVDQVLGGAPPTWADLDRLGFVEQIAKEGLRLYPPVYNFSRDSTEADDLGGCPVAPRQLTMLAVWGVHRSPQYWEDALAFDPDRFAPERASRIPRGAYLPFGVGKHTCIGIHFAMAEMTLALAHLGQRFRLALVEEREPRVKAQITLVPGEPIPLRLTSRRQG